MKVFVAYRDAPERRAALAAPTDALGRYRLFGLDQFEARGAEVRHNLGKRAPFWARAVDKAVNKVVYGLGGYGGDFASVLTSLREINRADVVLSTVDTVGIPLVLLKRFGLVRPPVVYIAVGLPERLVQLRRLHGLYRRALGNARAIVSYAESEVEWLRGWLGGANVVFVPFGVDAEAFRPVDREPELDVVSVGADPRRDFALLAGIAKRRPDLSFLVVASADHARTLSGVPVETDIPLEAVRDRLGSARVVALPVRDNSYSGATTTLLQAMAMAKPVVVSRTDAIASGYGLEDGLNCRLVPPGDAAAFEQALLETLTGADAARNLGIRARETVERSLSWERYTSALWRLLSR
ncbi:MAG TPA: glycosyltransferase family 4 protein [Gaiellaceae bacterium]|jgi:glycosyltransferase involved in cell wall biosynthesis|nr:glycosyltransferase family 4 protein [Gaiellaceae bacterium]